MTKDELALLLTAARVLRAQCESRRFLSPEMMEDYHALDDALKPFGPKRSPAVNEASYASQTERKRVGPTLNEVTDKSVYENWDPA